MDGMEEAAQPAADQPEAETPADEYAVVEIFGHRSHAGRIMEVDRFGAKMLRVDVPNEGDFEKGYVSHFYGGGALFSVTPTDLATVKRMNAPYRPPGYKSLPAPDDEDPDDDNMSASESFDDDDLTF